MIARVGDWVIADAQGVALAQARDGSCVNVALDEEGIHITTDGDCMVPRAVLDALLARAAIIHRYLKPSNMSEPL